MAEHRLNCSLKVVMTAVALFFSSSVWAAQYYVAPDGDDANPGTFAHPWQTLKRSINSVRPGDTVLLRGGDYMIDDTYPEDSIRFKGSVSGNAGASITFKNYQNEKPTLVFHQTQKTAPGNQTFIEIFGNFIIIDGLNFYQTEDSRSISLKNDAYTVKEMITTALTVRGDNVTIRNCSIDNFSGSGILQREESDHLLVEKNTVTNTGYTAFNITGKHGVWRNNIADGMRGYKNQQGIIIQYRTSYGNRVYGNVFKNGKASGVLFSGRASHNHVFNNFFMSPGSKYGSAFGSAVNLWCEDGPIGSGNRFYNNTITGTTNASLIFGGDCPNDPQILSKVDISDNIFSPSSIIPVGVKNHWPNISNNIFHNVQGFVPANNTVADPLVGPDGRLQVGSPAIDAGKSTEFPLDDFHGTLRPVGPKYDLGAVEWK